ncbi:DNA-directed DNA polymerase [Halodesulfurarchaeum sp. HSR-GB]|uniref:DNA-directed DNA polymerase n=1 Tax=Halodesulfurarchaeum sp. HSR-GB TaxID=3074077 RepID=UPI0028653D4E|nr:DNA-directed DNA polymerase [Halodesulfurarchaeum sp. HSR-GB]MDR5657239.1 DNA-directed DNA polymerase [Halodesulfurarchaeum sp. HSR-GB]
MQNADLSNFGGDPGGAVDSRVAEAEAVAGDADPVVSEILSAEADALPDVEETIDLAVTQVDYTVEGSGEHERPVIHVFGRTADNDLEHVRVHGFRPYFYAPTATLADGDLARDVITGHEEGFESIRGENLTRIYAKTPRDVGTIRDEFDHYEADILFPNRFLVDRDITSGITVPLRRGEDGAIYAHATEVDPIDMSPDLRVNTFDIEVDDRSGFPEDGEEPIISISSHDSYRDEYIAWLYEAPKGTGETPDTLSNHDPLQEDPSIEVRAFEDEAAMLTAFLDYIDETDPDVLTGWNFADFDAPYLLDRLDVLGLDSDRLSRVGEVWRSDWQGPSIKGRVVFDLLYGYQRTQFSELDSYRLEAVAAEEVGVGKERYSGDIGDLWEQDPERLLEYNLRDVELCVEIDRRQNIIDFWEEVAEFVGCKLEDATTPGDAVDMYVLHKVFGEFAVPSKGTQESEDYEGGAVFDPITGVREMVTVLDLKSLYPMCMVTINASPETKVDPDQYEGSTYRAPNGTHFRTEPDGIIREMVTELLSEREEKKARRNEHDPDSENYRLYDQQQAAVKVIMNSLYGVLGWERFRLYDKEMGAAVTATGRSVIEFTEQAANEQGLEVIYGDTDSVMLELGEGVSVEEAIDRSKELEAYINQSYDEFAKRELDADEHRFQIEFEKLYRRFFQAGKKKRYAGHIVWKEGKEVDDIDITGFEYKRSDIAPITKDVQKTVIERIVTEGDIEGTKEYVHDVIESFQDGQVDLDQVGIPGGIGKRLTDYETDTAHVRGAKYANLLLGTNFTRGSKPKRVYLKKVHPAFWQRIEAEEPEIAEMDLYLEFKRDPDVICYEYADQLPEEFSVDWDKMLEKTLKGPIARVLEALDISWEEVRDGQTQTGLGQYM